MSDPHKKLSKFLSFVLRHKPEHVGIELDAHGWADVGELLYGCKKAGKRIDRPLLEEVVRTNSKQRFEFNEDGDRIRASQGHSIEVELDYKAQEPPEFLYHGTATRFLPAIQAKGLLRMKRHHVHLSADEETAQKIGQRHGKPVVLRVAARTMAAAGEQFYLSTNGVWLVAHVAPEHIEFPEEGQ